MSDTISLPHIGRHNRIKLFTTFYPGDVDKISYPDQWALGQDALAAHQLLAWVHAFRKLTELGVSSGSPETFEMWKTLARTVLDQSERVV